MSGTPRLPGIEAARGLAALLVVLFHVEQIMALPENGGQLAFAGLFNFGRAGVDVFFVLSGFIIMIVHRADIGRPDRVRRFVWKRAWRIYSVYLVVNAAYFTALGFGHAPTWARTGWLHAVMSALLLPESAPPILQVGWSLRHELLFYSLFGVLVWNRRLGQAMLGVWATGIAANMLHAIVTHIWLFDGFWQVIVFRPYNIEFFFGIAAALLLRPWHPRLMLAAGLTLFLATGIQESFGRETFPEYPVLHLCYALGAATALYGAAAIQSVPTWSLALGRASYSIYLIHTLAVLAAAWALRRMHTALPLEMAFALLAGSGIMAGLVLSALVEQPLLRLVRPARTTEPAHA